jgi:hypothetical protein
MFVSVIVFDSGELVVSSGACLRQNRIKRLKAMTDDHFDDPRLVKILCDTVGAPPALRCFNNQFGFGH